jgi:hypothetical protein
MRLNYEIILSRQRSDPEPKLLRKKLPGQRLELYQIHKNYDRNH